MPQQRLYYDYVDNQLIPFWYVLTFSHFEIKWDERVQYFDLIKPFEFIYRDEFDDSLVNASLYLSDIVFNHETPNKIGLNVSSIKSRIMRYGVDPYVVKQLVLSTPEINDLLSMLPTERQMSLVVNS